MTCRIAITALMMLTLGGATGTGSLELEFEKLRSSKGLIRICLTTSSAHFPDCKGDPGAITRSIAADQPRTRFDALPVADYAIAVIHDENGNAKLDSVAGIPREGFGFSRNPAIGFGPPRFVAVRFAIGAGMTRQTVRMRYLL